MLRYNQGLSDAQVSALTTTLYCLSKDKWCFLPVWAKKIEQRSVTRFRVWEKNQKTKTHQLLEKSMVFLGFWNLKNFFSWVMLKHSPVAWFCGILAVRRTADFIEPLPRRSLKRSQWHHIKAQFTKVHSPPGKIHSSLVIWLKPRSYLIYQNPTQQIFTLLLQDHFPLEKNEEKEKIKLPTYTTYNFILSTGELGNLEFDSSSFILYFYVGFSVFYPEFLLIQHLLVI